MIKIDNIRISVSSDAWESLEKKIKKLLKLPESERINIKLLKRSIDARRKPDVFYLYSVAIECRDEKRLLSLRKPGIAISAYSKERYSIPRKNNKGSHRPVVTGFGPAGMFAAYVLAKAGYEPIVLERGKAADERLRDVKRFFCSGNLDVSSNVQFGEGGAGTFSDGKLNTSKRDKYLRSSFVLETFYEFGADESILVDAKPHLGTDRLIDIVKNIRNSIISLGGEVHFDSRLDEILTDGSSVCGVKLNDGKIIDCDTMILAIGHSARDTFKSLCEMGIAMQAKPFAMGFRIEHPQDFISKMQYGSAYRYLPPAPYKCVTKKGKHPLYSFCMCPGGYVINASSERGRLCVNGMSDFSRDSGNANSAMIMPVGEDYFDLDDPLSGVRFQQRIEKKAYDIADGRIPQQLFGDYVCGRVSTGYGGFSSKTKGRTAFGNLRGLIGGDFDETFSCAMRELGSYMKGFDSDEIILSGIEARTSSPVRILRDDRFMGSLRGLYPCGEGAGYAGGIMSAAMDGIRVAEAVMKNE